MATATQSANSGAVVAGSGLGTVTYVCSVATGTITVAAAVAALTNGDGGTCIGVEGTANGSIILIQGGPTPSVSGVTVEATIVG